MSTRSRTGIYKHRNSQNYYFKAKDENGQWKEFATGTSNYQRARKKKTEVEREIVEGCLPTERAAWSLKAAVEQWLRDRKVRVSSGTYASDVTNTRHLKSKFGEETKLVRLAELQAIKRFQTQRLEDKVSPKTVNNEILALAPSSKMPICGVAWQRGIRVL